MSETAGLDSWFLHDKLVLNLLSTEQAAELGQEIAALGSHPFAEARRIDLIERALVNFLAEQPVESLEILMLHGTLRVGALVWFEQAIAFKGLSSAIQKLEDGVADARAAFSAKLASNPGVRVRGTYNPMRLTCNTALSELSGTSREFVLGYVEDATTERIELRPIVIASRWFQPTPTIDSFEPVDPGYLWPEAVDQFADVDFSTRVSRSDLDVLKGVPESQIKSAFAEILGEPDVPKDWGGEQFDLWTANLRVDGQPLRAAFLFKGPAEFKPMTIASLGKNGDQIDRLSTTAADVLVVQHCHSITAPVVNMLRAYATEPRRPRRYLVIDGYNTIRILRHFGYIPLQ